MPTSYKELWAYVESITFTDPPAGHPEQARIHVTFAPYVHPCPDCGQPVPTIDASDPSLKQKITNEFSGKHTKQVKV